MQTVTHQHHQHIAQTITLRFYRYLIDLKFALKAEDFDDGLFAENNQTNNKSGPQELKVERILLDVEKTRLEREQAKAEFEQQAIADKAAWLQPRVIKHIRENLADHQAVLTSILKMSTNFTDLIGILYSPSMTYSRVANVLKLSPSLERIVLDMVNQNKIQNQIGRPVNQIIRDPQVAISLFGINGAKAVLPLMAIKQNMKFSNEYFPLLGFKLWKHMLANALGAHYILTQRNYPDPHEGLLGGLLMHLGKIAIYHQFIHSFSEVKTKYLIQFREEGRKDDHNALLQVEADNAIPFKLFCFLSNTLTFNLLQQLEINQFSPRGLLDSVIQVVNQVPFDDCDPLAQALKQGKAYSQIEQMRQAKLLTKRELSMFLESNRMTQTSIKNMIRENLTRVNLRKFVDK